ncbi:hypothetical protein KP509_11G047100 [Ceratopteris richardii]|nr:hypothetical protein KP509_11G047100 [Ceratopteris richardii]
MFYGPRRLLQRNEAAVIASKRNAESNDNTRNSVLEGVRERSFEHLTVSNSSWRRDEEKQASVPCLSSLSCNANRTSIDPRYGVDKRLVPTGPNPLHN